MIINVNSYLTIGCANFILYLKLISSFLALKFSLHFNHGFLKLLLQKDFR